MPLDIRDLMHNYARQGIACWKDAPNPVKLRAIAVLANKIAENDWQASSTIDGANATGAGGRFIPMPNINHDGILFCFFLPMRTKNGEQVQFSYDLFLLIDDENCLGFRFEPSDPADHAHGYAHVQMNRKMLKETFAAGGIPQWLSVSYPAFPIGTSDPLRMFLLMTMSIHGHGSGYKGGMSRVLLNAFPNRTRDAMRYLEELKDVLN